MVDYPLLHVATGGALALAVDVQTGKQRGYSDRRVYRIDRDGWVVAHDGEHVWPHGRTSAALRVDL